MQGAGSEIAAGVVVAYAEDGFGFCNAADDPPSPQLIRRFHMVASPSAVERNFCGGSDIISDNSTASRNIGWLVSHSIPPGAPWV